MIEATESQVQLCVYCLRIWLDGWTITQEWMDANKEVIVWAMLCRGSLGDSSYLFHPLPDHQHQKVVLKEFSKGTPKYFFS